jgi:DUF1365 family protein
VTADFRSCLYAGTVMHRRISPFSHRFAYRVFSLLLDLDEADALGRALRFFSHNRFNLLSFHDRDHGPRDGTGLKPWIAGVVAASGADYALGRVTLLCFPRLLGYVFNPLSIFFCHDEAGRLRSILYDVSNTFGDKHGYFIDVPPSNDGLIVQSCAKSFHVSPFLPLEGSYRFRLRAPDERLSILIRQGGPDGSALIATQTGTREPLTDARLAANLLKHPLMTLKVMGAIHFEALRLWLKGARFHRRPEPPLDSVTFVEATAEPSEHRAA